MSDPSIEMQDSFIYPKFIWPHDNKEDINMESNDTAEATRQRLSAVSSSSAQTDASSSTSVLPGVAGVQSGGLQAHSAETSKSKLTPSTSGLISSGRKRTLSEKEKARKMQIKKRRMMEVDAPVINVHTAPETAMMRHGRLLGFNLVTDSNNYIIAQSAFGYGNISQSNDAKRRPGISAHSSNVEIAGSGNILASTNSGTSLGYNVVPGRGEYLVVQSAYGYGDISQSGASKRISQCSGNGLGCSSNKRFCY